MQKSLQALQVTSSITLADDPVQKFLSRSRVAVKPQLRFQKLRLCMPSTVFATTFRVSKFAGARLSIACSRAHRLLSSTASKALCFAPIRATRQSIQVLRDSTSKFPFVDTFKLSSGELYRSAEVIAGLAPLATSKRLATLDKVRSLLQLGVERKPDKRRYIYTPSFVELSLSRK